MNRPVSLIAALLLCASVLAAPARAIPPGVYDVKWTGVVDVFLYNTTGNPGFIPANPIDNTTAPGQPVGYTNVTVCPAGPDGIQLFAGPVTAPSTVLTPPFVYEYTGMTFFTFGFIQSDLIPILPLTGVIDNDGGIPADILSEVDLLLDKSEDTHTAVFVDPPALPGSVLMLLAHKPDPSMNGLDDDAVPYTRSNVYTSSGLSTARMTLDPFPTNEVTGIGTPLDPACDPTAIPSTCTAKVIQQPATPCGTQGPNMANWDCSFVEVTNVIARFDLDVIFTKTGDLPPGADCNDTDSDGILDFADNCVNVANGPLASSAPGAPVLADADEDYIGSACDCDFDQNNTCGFSDFTLFLDNFGNFCPQVSAGEKSAAEILACDIVDMDRNDTVGFNDFTLFLDGFGGSPGPSNLPGS